MFSGKALDGNSPPWGFRGWKGFVSNSWWVLLFLIGCFSTYAHAMQKKGDVERILQEQLEVLSLQKQDLLQEKEDLLLQIQSQEDPRWIEMTLMKGLGLVPEGKLKVFFQKEERSRLMNLDMDKSGQAA
ncbi:MAG: hypothetical protein HYZ48_02480 [Chlamydiales bacterium]|nr:hypothetical protein [Chlamydiales bacterium]